MNRITNIIFVGLVLYSSVVGAFFPYLIGKSVISHAISRRIISNPNKINHDIKEFFDIFYLSNGLKYKIVDSGHGYYRIHLDSVKNHLISNHNYWESFDVLLIVLKNNGEWDVLCDVSGFYSPGIGGSLPDRSSYYSINKDYPDNLAAYAANVVSSFEEFVKLKNNRQLHKGEKKSDE